MSTPLMPELPEPLALVAQFCGEWRETASTFAQPVFSTDQLRAYGLAVWKAAMNQAARELEKIASIVSGPHESDGHYANLYACASAIRSLPLPESDMTQARGE